MRENLLTAAAIIGAGSLAEADITVESDKVIQQRLFVIAFLAKITELGKFQNSEKKTAADILIDIKPMFMTLLELLANYDSTETTLEKTKNFLKSEER